MNQRLDTNQRLAQLNLSNPQLFLDDRWVKADGHITRVWHQARKYPRPVLTADRPWEYNCPVAYGTVLYRGGQFHMWYTTWTRATRPRVCYAQSDNGIHWKKPDLGLHAFNGDKRNNIVLVACDDANQGFIDNISVIDDPEDTDWPLKALYWDSGKAGDQHANASPTQGHYAARSKDGIHWESLGWVLPGYGDRCNAMSDKHRGKYVAFVREPNMKAYERGRVVSRIESDDLLHWTEPKLLLHADADDPPLLEFYSATCFAYGDDLMGFIERMHCRPDRVDSELTWSADGVQWCRSRKRPGFLAWGPQGAWDDTWINLTSNAPIRVGKELWFFYSGRSAAHGVAFPHNHGAIGLATLRGDGFCSIYAEDDGGHLLTHPMPWPDADLLVNYHTQADADGRPAQLLGGEVRVEVFDADHHVLPGFAAADCRPLGTSTKTLQGQCYAPVTWGKGRSLREHAGQTVHLCFRIRKAHLYAFKAGSAGSCKEG